MQALIVNYLTTFETYVQVHLPLSKYRTAFLCQLPIFPSRQLSSICGSHIRNTVLLKSSWRLPWTK